MRKRTGIIIGIIVAVVAIIAAFVSLLVATPIGSDVVGVITGVGNVNGGGSSTVMNINVFDDDNDDDDGNATDDGSVDDANGNKDTSGDRMGVDVIDIDSADNDNGDDVSDNVNGGSEGGDSSTDAMSMLPDSVSNIVESIVTDCESIAGNRDKFDDDIGDPIKGILSGDVEFYAPFAVVQNALENATITGESWRLVSRNSSIDRYVYRIDAATDNGDDFSAVYSLNTVSFDTKTGKITELDAHLA